MKMKKLANQSWLNFHLLLSLSIFAGSAFSSGSLGLWQANNPETARALLEVTGSESLLDAAVDVHGVCRIPDASEIVETTRGTFYTCKGDFESAIAFLPNVEDESSAVVLAEIKDGRYSSYGVRKVWYGDGCVRVYSTVGEGCFSSIASDLSRQFLPELRSKNISDETLASFIKGTYHPITAEFPGEVSMCFPDTGTWKTKGLSADSASLSRAARRSAYAACENSEGDKRFWARHGWNNIRVFGVAALAIPIVVVNIVPSILLGLSAASKK